MITSTLTDLDALFKTAITGITPRFQRGSGVHLWKVHERNAQSSQNNRRFNINWVTVGRTPPPAIYRQDDVDTTVECHIITDYNYPQQISDEIVEDDFYQLRDILNALKGSTNGLIFVENEAAEEIETGNADQFQIDHFLMVRYLKARA